MAKQFFIRRSGKVVGPIVADKLKEKGLLRHRRFVPLVFESSGYARGNVRALFKKWSKIAEKRLGPERFAAHEGSSTRRTCSTIIQFWNAVSVVARVGCRALTVVSERA